MGRDTHHVVPDGEGGWDVKRGGSDRASRNFDNKADAVDYGRQVSKNAGTEFIVHKKDGTIQNPDSHGRDPNPPKDRK